MNMCVACLVIWAGNEPPRDCDNNYEPLINNKAVACFDNDPCTKDFFSGDYGCRHEKWPDGTACFGDDSIGQCENGMCVVEHSNGFSDTICASESDGCYGTEPYVVNRLDGSCLVEWCNFDKPGRSVQQKPAGSPCVRGKEGVPEFTTSQCGPCGTCL